jgi:hypothetical protein
MHGREKNFLSAVGRGCGVSVVGERSVKSFSAKGFSAKGFSAKGEARAARRYVAELTDIPYIIRDAHVGPTYVTIYATTPTTTQTDTTKNT